MFALRAFVRLGPGGQLRLAASWVLLGATRLMILVMPFSWVRRLLNSHGASAQPPRLLAAAEERRVRSIAASIAIASTRTPWRSECYPQALTARLQLIAARLPHTVEFGLKRGHDGELMAHAWVTAGNIPVSGGTSADYTVVGSFPWSP